MITPLPAGTIDSGCNDEQLTADREETKYLLSHEKLTPFVEALAGRLGLHHFAGEGASRLLGPHHFTTTIYFDTPSGIQLEAARRDAAHNVKVRAKEYHDLYPSLAELATDASQIVRYQPWLWFELKRRDGARTTKRRFRLLKQDVPRFLAQGRVSPDWLFGRVSDAGRQSTQELEQIAAYCRDLSEPLSACALVNYRRLSFQDAPGDLRVTLDLGLSVYEPPVDLWTRQEPLVRDTLGPRLGSTPDAVLEIKSRAGMPAWLTQELTRADLQEVSFSKFVTAASIVQQALTRRAGCGGD